MTSNSAVTAVKGLYSRPYFLLILATGFWGANAVAGRLAAGSVPPLTLTAARWIGAATILFFLARPLLPAAMPVLKARWRYLFACGAIGFAMFNTALYGALNFTSAINVSIEQAAMPMAIILLTYVVYREPVTWLQFVGLIVSMSGVLLTVTHGDPAAILRLDLNLGDAIMVVAIFTYSAYSVALRHRPDLPWQVFMFALALSAAIAALPGLAYDLASGRYPAANWITPSVLLFVVVFPSLVSQVFYARGVQMIGANRAGLFFNLVPVFGTALAIVLVGETFHAYQAVGLVLVIGGIALAEYSVRRKTGSPA